MNRETKRRVLKALGIAIVATAGLSWLALGIGILIVAWPVFPLWFLGSLIVAGMAVEDFA